MLHEHTLTYYTSVASRVGRHRSKTSNVNFYQQNPDLISAKQGFLFFLFHQRLPFPMAH